MGNLFDHNKITNIPSSLGNIESLERLILNNNLIDDYLPESLNNLPNLDLILLDYNINIKGKTLINVRDCSYYPPIKGNTYSLCESVDAICKDESLQQCEEKN